jgi:hypothetical protein
MLLKVRHDPSSNHSDGDLGDEMKDEKAERAAFEKWIGEMPYERAIDRWDMDDENTGWPGQYKDYETELAWCAWQERAKGDSGGA